jgi:hypothetical protein
LEENHHFNSLDYSIDFNLSDELKIKLIDYLIDNNIPLKMTDFGNVNNFEIQNKSIQITNTPKRKYKYHLKLDV